MFSLLPRPASRRTRSLIIVLVLLLNMLPAPAAAARAALAFAQEQSFVRVVSLATNHIVYDKQTQKIYASVPSSAGAGGNSVAEVDPASGAVVQSVFVGSEPNKLALSDDGQVLYAALDGAASVRRFDIPTHTAGQQFALGADQIFSSPFLAGDLAVLPGNPNAVAVAKTRPGVSPPGGGVAVYDNGVQRPNTSPSFSGPSFITFSASASTLYGSVQFSGGLQTLTVDGTGVSLTSTSSFTFVGDIQFENGLVYNALGQVANPATNALVGSFAGAGSGPFVVDSSVGRAYFIVNASTILNQTITLRAYDINTFTPVGEVTVSGVNGAPTSLVRWGANGLAFRTAAGQLFLIQTSLVPSQETVPAPTPTPSPTPTPTPVPFDTSVRQIELTTKDLVYSPSSQTIYASLPSSAKQGGNSVTQIDPATGAVGTPVFVGSEPNKLALSDDGQALYVGLDGASSVRRFDTAAQTPGPQFFLGSDTFSGPFNATDIAVMPGSPQTVAVAKGAFSTNVVAVYDGVTQRPNTGGGGPFGSPEVEFGATPSRLYSGGAATGGGVTRFLVNASGLTADGTASTNGGSIRFAGGLLYTANGSVVDPETNSLKGTFTGNGLKFNSLMAVDPALGRVYFLSISGLTGLLRAYDLNTFLPVGQVTIPNVGFTQNPDGFQFSSLVRWGQNGLAFRTTTHVMLIQSALINPSGTVPAPTPTPSPTPTPTPTPEAPTFVRQVNLPVNDFAFSSSAQKFYASVPSVAGPGGNSIVEVDPASGSTGAPVFVGSEPTRLAVSDNGQVIWASLEGAQALRRFDVATKTAGLQFSLTNTRPTDLEVMPGSPQTLAVAAGGAPLIFDDGVQRPPAPFSPRIAAGQIEFSSNPSTLYGYNNGDTGFDFYRMNVSSSGVSFAASAQGLVGGGFAGGIKYAGGRMYTTTGRVFNPDTFVPLGLHKGAALFSSAVAVDTTLKRAFYAVENGSNMILRAYDTDTFLPVGQVTLPVAGTPLRLVRWGANGLALRASSSGFGTLDGRLYILQSALVSPSAPVPTGVQFAAASSFVSEGAGSVTVSVIRTGDLSAASSIDYATTDGTASERSDYTTAIGTLRFAPGESQKSFRVLITNDNLQEGNETINVTLSNPSGAQLVLPDKFLITIQDDDFSPPTSNPADDAQFFVRQHYRDFLNRLPDTSGLNFWTNEINSCGADAACREVKRINVSAAFFLSIEFQNTGYLVYRLHHAAFGTGETLGMRTFLKDTQEIGGGVIVGAQGWEQQLEANKQDFVNRFAARPEFAAAFPASLSPSQFVDALNAHTTDPRQPSSGGALTQAERDQLVADLSAGLKTRAEVLRAVAENAEFQRRQFNKAFVYMQYVGYLRRAPNETPDTNFDGYNFWLSKLDQFNGDFVAAEMVKAFISSTEYRKRFGQ